MELNITKFVQNAAPRDYCASVAEIGNNAGAYTWRAACDDAPDWNFLDSDDKRTEFREWISTFGAWSDDEIAAWSDVELNALCIQMISGSMRECDIGADMSAEDWARVESMQERGNVSSDIYRSDDGQIYFYAGC